MANLGKAHVDMRVAEGLTKLLLGGHTPTAKKVFKRVAYAFAARQRDKLRASAPKDTGKLKRAVKARTTRAGGAAVFVDKKRAPHFFFPEAGTKARANKKGANRGKVNATPYIEPWRKQAQDAVSSEITRPLLAELKAQVLKGMSAK